MAIKYKEFKFFSDSDKLEIDCMAVAPDGEIKGVLQIVHGMCEHKERYYDFMKYIAEKGFLCVIHDNRGHGKSVHSDADLGYFYDGGYTALVEDIHKLTEIVKEHVGEVPYYLMGHSMGSMAVRCYLKKYDADIDGLVVVGSPSKPSATELGLNVAKMISRIKGGHAHSWILDNMVVNFAFERRYKSERLLHSWICSDKKVVAAYNRDRYCNFNFTINGYINLIELTREAYDKKGWKMNNPGIPIIFLSGKDDPCNISPSHFGKSVHFLKEVGYENVEARLYGNMRHEILNEKRKKRVYRDIYDFISGNLKSV